MGVTDVEAVATVLARRFGVRVVNVSRFVEFCRREHQADYHAAVAEVFRGRSA